MSSPREREIDTRDLSALVVDDDSVMRRAMVGILRERLNIGTVTEVANGLEALRLLKKEKFDIVLADWMMPVMDGYNFVKTVRQNPVLFDIPIIMVTSKRSQRDIMDIMKAGVTDYVLKPFEEGKLIEKINLAVRLASASRKESEYLAKAENSYMEKNYDEALQNYNLASDMVPGRVETKVKIAEVLIEKGDVEKADDALKHVVRNPLTKDLSKKAGRLLTRIGNHHFENERIPRAEEKYGEAIKVDSMQAGARLGMGNVELKKGNREAAQKYFNEVLTLDVEEDDMQEFNLIAIGHRRGGRPLDAIKVLEHALVHFPKEAVLHYNMGRAYLDVRDKEKAAESFKKAMEARPNFVEAEKMLDLIKIGRV